MQWFRSNLKAYYKHIAAASLVSLLFFVSARPALAGVSEGIGTIVSWLLSYVNYALGHILIFLLHILVDIAKYNGFINAEPIKLGWVIVRDLCNMFFVLILLVIAFATILRVESYNAKRWLPKLLIMAILINFSRTISGLIIDFSQVIMLTFVNALAQNGANNLVAMFQINRYTSFSDVTFKIDEKDTLLGYRVFLGSVAGTIALLITLVVSVVLIIVLVMRIVMLWIYVILSPLAYLLSSFPGGAAYAGRWWSEFTKQVITGPILAFFLWLALVTTTATGQALGTFDDSASGAGNFNSTVSGGTNLFTSGPFQQYIITIGMLVGGLIITQQAGGTAGKAAGWGMGKIQKGQAWTTGKIRRKVEDSTGYSAAKEYIGQRSAQREAARQDRIQMQAAGLAVGVGALGKVAGAPKQFVADKWNTLGNKANKLNAEVRSDKGRLSKLRAGFDKDTSDKLAKSTLELGGKKYDRTKNGKWVEKLGNGIYNEYNKEEILEKIKAGDTRHAAINDLEKAINQKETAAKTAAQRQRKMNKARDAGLLLGGLGFSVSHFGLGGGALAALATRGGFGLGKLAKLPVNQDRLSKPNADIISKYRSDKITKTRDGMKPDSNEAILATMDDASKDALTRMAALMEAMSRNIVDSSKVRAKMGELQNESILGGVKRDKKGADEYGWADKKLNSQFNALFNKKQFAGAGETWTKAMAGDQDAKDDIRQGFDDGTYAMKDLDVESLTSAIEELATGMKTGKFVKDFKELDVSKQNAVIEALRRSTEYEAKAKLAFVRNIEEAFAGDDGGRDKFLSGLTINQLQDMVKDNSDPAKYQKLIEAINGNQQKLSVTVQAYLDDGSSNASALAKQLKIQRQTTTTT